MLKRHKRSESQDKTRVCLNGMLCFWKQSPKNSFLQPAQVVGNPSGFFPSCIFNAFDIHIYQNRSPLCLTRSLINSHETFYINCTVLWYSQQLLPFQAHSPPILLQWRLMQVKNWMLCSNNLTHNKLLGFNPTNFYKSKKIGFLEL